MVGDCCTSRLLGGREGGWWQVISLRGEGAEMANLECEMGEEGGEFGSSGGSGWLCGLICIRMAAVELNG